MSNLFDKWKESVITVYDSQEMSTLELLEDITSFNDEIAKGIDDLDLKIDTEVNNLNLQKTDLNGDHKGTWQGLNRPTLSDEGLRATVEVMKPTLDKINNDDIPSINSQLEQNKNIIDESGLERVSATSKFITTMQSWLGLINTKFTDNATRFYLLAKDKVTTGVGGCLKIFADAYHLGQDYRDFGLYFSADQNGEKGYYGNGAFYLNVKVNEDGVYNGKMPDLIITGQDGKMVVGRVVYFGNGKPIFVFGENKPTSQMQGVFYGVEFQKDIAFLNEKGISFLKADGSVGGNIRCNVDGNTILSLLQKGIFAVNGVNIFSVDENKVQFEKSTYHNGNVVFNDHTKGTVLKSPNGTQYKIKVDDSGTVTSERVG